LKSDILIYAAALVLIIVAGVRVEPALADHARESERRELGALLESQRALLVVFQESDCDSWRPFITEWRRLGVRVIGVPLNARDAATLDRVRMVFPQQFPLRPELATYANRALMRSGERFTPSAMLVDGSGRVRMVLPAHRITNNQLTVQAVVTSYLSIME
jgi:hypothetical protein